jgi:two-component system response regulator LytT
MKIIIIEDEPLTAADLAESIVEVEPAAKVMAVIHSVKEAISFFERQFAVDLIFSDIQLGDGLSFELFRTVPIRVPVVFCTAYDEYAMAAFKANGIDYILKPFTKSDIKAAIEKYKGLTSPTGTLVTYESILQQFQAKDRSVLVYYKDKIFPVAVSEIALFYIHNEINHLVTLQGQSYMVSRSIDELEKITGREFYRANRKTLVNRKAIQEVSQLSQRKLLINLVLPVPVKESLTVSKEKISSFLSWLSGN